MGVKGGQYFRYEIFPLFLKHEEITNNSNLTYLLTYSILLGQNASQELIFSPDPCINCNVKKNDFVSRIAADSLTKSSTVFAVQALGDFVDENGAITVNFGTGVANKIKFIPTYFETDIEVDYVWMGKDTSGDNTLLLAGNQGYFTGIINTQQENYEILPVSAGHSIIRKVDHEKLPDLRCGLTDTLLSSGEIALENQIDVCEEDNVCASTIDILVLLPPDVINFYGDDFSHPLAAALHLFLGHYTFLFAMLESGYTDLRIRVSFSTIDYPYSFNTYRIDAYEVLPQVASQLRADYRADLVVLSTDVSYFDNIAGTANVGESDENNVWEAPCFDCAFAVANIRAMMSPRWTLAHEIAHLFSARHNDDGNGAECGHGFQFKLEVGANRTAMHKLLTDSSQVGHSRVLAFSTPDVTIDNVPIGTSSFFNNALVINNSACKIEDYYDPSILGVRIINPSGPVLCSLLGTPNTKTLSADIISPAQGFPGLPPYTYQWRWREDGVFSDANPGNLLGTSNSVIINSALGCPRFFVKLTVTSSDGEVATATTQINTNLCDSCSESGLNSDGRQHIFNNIAFVGENSEKPTVYPNPVGGTLNIMGVKEYATIELFDMRGKLIVNVSNASRQAQLRIETMDLKPGMYFVRMSTETNSHSLKFLKSN